MKSVGKTWAAHVSAKGFRLGLAVSQLSACFSLYRGGEDGVELKKHSEI